MLCIILYYTEFYHIILYYILWEAVTQFRSEGKGLCVWVEAAPGKFAAGSLDPNNRQQVLRVAAIPISTRFKVFFFFFFLRDLFSTVQAGLRSIGLREWKNTDTYYP